MKNNLKKRLSLLLAMLIVVASFAGCKSGNQSNPTSTTHGGTAANVQGSDKDSSAELAAIQAQIDGLSKSLDDAKASLEEYQASIKELEAENQQLKAKADESAKALEDANAEMLKQAAESAKTLNAAKAENVALEAKISALEAEIAKLETEKAVLEGKNRPAVEIIGGKIYADLEYVLKAIIFNFEDGTAALKATTVGIPVNVDFREVIGSKTDYRVNSVMLPRKGYDYAVTYDCVSVYKVSTGTSNQAYSYSNAGLFLGSQLNTGYELKETTLRGLFGLTDDLLEAVIVAVDDPSAEYGYSFFVRVGNYRENPVFEPKCKHGDGCHCGNCDACPALEPEKIIETREVIKVVHCDKCGHNEGPCPAECTCECCPAPEKEIVTETEFVYLPIYVPVQDDSNPGHTDRPEAPDITQNPEDPSNDEKPSDPGHNDRQEVPDITQDPEDPSNDVIQPNHSDSEDGVTGDNSGDLTQTPEDPKNDINAGHSDREDITGGSSTVDITGTDNTHSTRGDEGRGDITQSLHSPRE